MPIADRCSTPGCSSTTGLARHHPDIDGDPGRVVVLCRSCHAREDMRLGLHRMPAPGVRREARAADRPVVLPSVQPSGLGPAVYLVGAPGTGKTTLARCWAGRRIDTTDRDPSETEAAAAGRLVLELQRPGAALIEGTGVSAPINAAVAAAAGRLGRPVHVVALHCDDAQIAQRIRERNREPLWGDRDALTRWAQRCAWRLPRLWPGATWVDTSGEEEDSLRRLAAALADQPPHRHA